MRKWVGPDEVLLFLGLILATAGIWSRCGVVALTVPGLVLVWIALPTRRGFVERPPVLPARRKP